MSITNFVKNHKNLLQICKPIYHIFLGFKLKLMSVFPVFFLTRNDGYLRKVGWINAARKMLPIDNKLNPIPWYTYSLIDFIQPRLNKNLTVFEYGSGNSTLWWSKFVKQVISCEHDKKWIGKLNPVPNNVKLVYKESEEDYDNYIKEYKDYFDLIVIDGIKRETCTKNCLGSLKPAGIIIVDDTDDSFYNNICEYLIFHGFKRLDFWGMKAIVYDKFCTSIFYKENNCMKF